MTEFTYRARAEAEKRWHPTIRSGINQPPFGPTDYLDEGMASGFVLGALWAAEQDPTEEEIEYLCEVMHNAYEDAAVHEGWQTQQASRKPWGDVPGANKATMRVAVRAVLLAARDVRRSS